jgi:hypothetical protein
MSEEKSPQENKALMVLSKVNTGIRQTAITIDYSTVNYAKLESIYKTDQLVFQAEMNDVG